MLTLITNRLLAGELIHYLSGGIMDDIEITEQDIEKTILSLHDTLQQELFQCQEEDLEKYWHFKYNEKLSLVHNLYKFYDLLKLYHGFCRRWEEHTNGPSCVVERVRDKYLIPKIKNFIDAMKTGNKSINRDKK